MRDHEAPVHPLPSPGGPLWHPRDLAASGVISPPEPGTCHVIPVLFAVTAADYPPDDLSSSLPGRRSQASRPVVPFVGHLCPPEEGHTGACRLPGPSWRVSASGRPWRPPACFPPLCALPPQSARTPAPCFPSIFPGKAAANSPENRRPLEAPSILGCLSLDLGVCTCGWRGREKTRVPSHLSL